ncbi:MAG: branched-chain amino acid ABC transporter permease, partial [Hyphomicrobium sp.]|nr:branched-chain amino acid ABC transporter permease [Hyphomicrobium sp.]
GGFGSFVGAVVGSYFIAFVAAFASYLGASHWQDSSVFVLLAVVLLVRPDGIFGRPTAERV